MAYLLYTTFSKVDYPTEEELEAAIARLKPDTPYIVAEEVEGPAPYNYIVRAPQPLWEYLMRREMAYAAHVAAYPIGYSGHDGTFYDRRRLGERYLEDE